VKTGQLQSSPGADAKRVQRRIRAAHLPAEATPEGLDFAFIAKLPTAEIRDLAGLQFIAAGERVTFSGAVGVAKTTSPPPLATSPVGAGTTSCSPPARAFWPSLPADVATRASPPVW